MREKNDFEYEQFLRSELLDKYNKGKKVSKERDQGIWVIQTAISLTLIWVSFFGHYFWMEVGGTKLPLS